MKPEPIYEEIGGIIRSLRRRADMAQEALAGQLGISRATLANIETGRQRILVHQLYAIAEALGVKLGELLPPPRDKAATEKWAVLNFHGDLNDQQKQQLANLIGAPASGRTEETNAKTTDSTARNTRKPGAKPAR